MFDPPNLVWVLPLLIFSVWIARGSGGVDDYLKGKMLEELERLRPASEAAEEALRKRENK